MEKASRQITWIIGLLLILAALPARPHRTWAAPRLPRTLSVDTGSDTPGGACTAAQNDCSLRSAIDLANTDPGSTISFEGTTRTVILTTGSLPIITAANTTIMGNAGQLIKINANGQTSGLRVSGDRVRIQGLYVFGANLYNLHIALTAAQQVYIANNIIGDDNVAGCSTTEVLTNNGLYVTRAATFTPGNHDVWIYGNRIECNQEQPHGNGITLDNIDRVRVGFKEPGSTATVETNTIRLNYDGIHITNGATANQIRGNVISANLSDGIFIDDSTTAANEIFANKIGTTADGLQADGNADAGIDINEATTTLIGGTPARRNIISGNGTSGVELDLSASGNIVQSNYIGTNLLGTAVIPNSQHGVWLQSGANNNLIGGTLFAHLNVIAGNTQQGIMIQHAGTDSNTITFNDIGLNSALSDLPLPNGARGILIRNGPQNNVIGSAATISPRPGSLATPQTSRAPLESRVIDPAANAIWYNTQAGIALDDASNNLIRSNSIRKNSLGIYLLNDSQNNTITRTLMYENNSFGIIEDTGATNNSWFELSMYGNNTNGQQIGQFPTPAPPRPRITSIARPSRTFQGTSSANALVEVYAHNAFTWTFNQTPVPQGQGRRFLGRTRADANGRWSLQVAATALRGIQNNCFTAIQTTSTGSSEFSQIVCGKTYAPYAIKSSP